MKSLVKFIKSIFSNVYVIKASYKNEVLTVQWSNEEIEDFLGSSTVWHKMPNMDRCDIYTECLLSELYIYLKKWGNEYPTAHLGQYSKGIK